MSAQLGMLTEVDVGDVLCAGCVHPTHAGLCGELVELASSGIEDHDLNLRSTYFGVCGCDAITQPDPEERR